MRERSYASEPGSRIALKLDAEKETVDGQDKNDMMNADDDDDDDTIECDVGVRTSTFSEPLDFGRRSQTLLDAQTPPATPPVVSVQQKKIQKYLYWRTQTKKPKNQKATSVFFTNIVFISPVKCAATSKNNKLAHTPLYISYIYYIYLLYNTIS